MGHQQIYALCCSFICFPITIADPGVGKRGLGFTPLSFKNRHKHLPFNTMFFYSMFLDPLTNFLNSLLYRSTILRHLYVTVWWQCYCTLSLILQPLLCYKIVTKTLSFVKLVLKSKLLTKSIIPAVNVLTMRVARARASITLKIT